MVQLGAGQPRSEQRARRRTCPLTYSTALATPQTTADTIRLPFHQAAAPHTRQGSGRSFRFPWRSSPMSIPCEERQGKRKERPEPCRVCGAAAWWNGSRMVSAVVCGVANAVEYVSGQVRRRARCSDRGCPAPSWTMYPQGSYPHRTFQLDVVSSAVAQVAAGESARQAAERHQCSRRSVSRWRGWCAQLVVPEELAAAAVRLDPDGLPPPARGGKEAKEDRKSTRLNS